MVHNIFSVPHTSFWSIVLKFVYSYVWTVLQFAAYSSVTSCKTGSHFVQTVFSW